jgi:hypothetical protein
MSVLWLKRVGDTLVPASAESAAIFTRLKFGRTLKCEVREPRNAKHHALYWTICQRIANAVGAEPQNVSDLLKIEAGHYRLVRSKKYGDLRLPRSISFKEMSQDDFSAFFEKVLLVIKENWGGEAMDAIADLVAELKL